MFVEPKVEIATDNNSVANRTVFCHASLLNKKIMNNTSLRRLKVKIVNTNENTLLVVVGNDAGKATSWDESLMFACVVSAKCSLGN